MHSITGQKNQELVFCPKCKTQQLFFYQLIWKQFQSYVYNQENSIFLCETHDEQWLQWRTLSLFLEPHSCNCHEGSINWIRYLLHQSPNTWNTFSSFLCCHCNCWCYNQCENKFLANNSECISCHYQDEIIKFITVNITIEVDITALQIVVRITLSSNRPIIIIFRRRKKSM